MQHTECVSKSGSGVLVINDKTHYVALSWVVGFVVLQKVCG